MIGAAVEVFGRDGYRAATTKTIARRAGANQALISYYFGGKEGLYTAAVEHVAEQIALRMEPVAAEVDTRRRQLDAADSRERRAACFELLCRMLDGLVDVLTSSGAADWARIIVREQQEPSAAFEILYGRVQRRSLELMAWLVAGSVGRRTPSADDRLLVITMLGQALVFRMARAAALRFLGWEGLQPRNAERVRKLLRRNAAAVLGIEEN